MSMLLGVGFGEGGDGSSFFNRLSVWIFDGNGWLTLHCGLIVPEDRYGRRVVGYVLGMGLVVWVFMV